MLVVDPQAGREALREALDAASSLVVFTGAGISTSAGIPDFRSPGSLWTRNKPIPFEAFLASAEARREAWRRKFAMDDSYRGARPTHAHRVVAAWAQAGRATVITQNIDGLHQDSGVPDEALIELHGNGTFAACLSCGTRHELAAIRVAFEAEGEAPACRTCGGLVKSATISFGQPMPQAALQRAQRAARQADVFLVVGSSLVVYPAAALPLAGKAHGARLVILNREATELDGAADLVVRCDIEAAFAAWAV